MPVWDYKSPQRLQPISRPTVPKTLIGFHIPRLTFIVGRKEGHPHEHRSGSFPGRDTRQSGTSDDH